MMQQGFDGFLAAWKNVMTAKGGISLPARADITLDKFKEWLPFLMIARWDFDIPDSKVLYAGSAIDELFTVDVGTTALKNFFSDPDQMQRHVETARHVVTELVGAYAEATVSLSDGRVHTFAHLRLPLAPENGYPMIVSLFQTERDANDHAVMNSQPDVRVTSNEFVTLFDDE